MTSTRPLITRKTDLTILIFLCLHTFFCSCIDCLELYPPIIHSIPPFPSLFKIRQFYIDTYHDKFLIEPPRWFVICTWLELVYHVPTCLWAIRGLYRDDALVPIGLLIWAVETFVTTLVCVVELWDWTDRTDEVKWGLTGCYGPYLVVSAGIMAIMCGRLKEALLAQKQQQLVKVKGQ